MFISALLVMWHDGDSKSMYGSTLVKSSWKLSSLPLLQFKAVKLQKQDTHALTYKQRNNNMAKLQLALSSLCMLHEGVHAVLVNQDYSAEQRLDMAVSNLLRKATRCSFLGGLH